MRNINDDDGILDSLTVRYATEEQKYNFKRFYRVTLAPLLVFFVFFLYYFVFVMPDWLIFSVITRVIFVVLMTVAILLLSYESLEWRLLSITIIVSTMVIDIMAQMMGFYDELTILGENLKYDFLGHIFTGLVSVAFLSNLLKNTERKIIWIIVGSLAIAFIWEFMEWGLAIASETAIKREIKQFQWDALNSVSDIIAHGIGLGIMIFGYIFYKFLRCPEAYRQGLMCKL